MDSFLLLNAKPNRWWTESNTEESADLPSLAWRNEGVLATVVMWAGWGKSKAPDSASTREVPLSPAFYFEVHYRSMFTGNTSCLQEKQRKKAWNPLQYKGHRGRGWGFSHTKEKILISSTWLLDSGITHTHNLGGPSSQEKPYIKPSS